MFSFRRSPTTITIVFSVIVFRWHQYPDLRIAAQDHIWTLNSGGILSATWTNSGGSQTPVSFVLKGSSIKLTGDPGATGGVPVVCLSSPFGYPLIFVSSPPSGTSPCPFLMAMTICKGPTSNFCLVALVTFLMWSCSPRALASRLRRINTIFVALMIVR